MNRRDWMQRALAALAVVPALEFLREHENTYVTPAEAEDWADEMLSKPYPKYVAAEDLAEGELVAFDPAGQVIGARTSPDVFFGQRPRLHLSLSMHHCPEADMLKEAYFKEHVVRVEHNGVSCRMVVSKVEGFLNPNASSVFAFELIEVFHVGEYDRIVSFSLDRALRSVVLKGETSVSMQSSRA